MNILFLSLDKIWTINKDGIYPDLLREFARRGHRVYILSPIEKRDKKRTPKIIEEENSIIIKVEIGNIQKTNVIEKGFSTLAIEGQFVDSIKKNLSDVKFDLVLYPTPPITFQKAIEFVKNRDGAMSYLMLKDIFPQNAVDLGMMSKKSPIYKYFRNKEKKLYQVSDYIGCMSQANVDYLLEHNDYLDRDMVEIFPNSIEIKENNIVIDRDEILTKYGIPKDRIIFVYGGNLGRPQSIPFIIECLRSQKDDDKAFFLIVGNGTEYSKLESYIKEDKQTNVKLIPFLPKDEYDMLISACDVGLIFLDYRFTIPNYPSRLLGYMEAGLPVFAVTDKNTDIGKDIVEGGFGWWIESSDPQKFSDKIENEILPADLSEMKLKEESYLKEKFNVKTCIDTIFSHIN